MIGRGRNERAVRAYGVRMAGMTSVASVRTVAVAGLALLLGLAVAGTAMAQGGGGEAASVEVRVWQHVDDERDLYLSARPAGGSWRTLGTVPLALDGLTASEGYRYGDIALALPEGEGEAEVEVRVWQDASLRTGIFASVRLAGGAWSVPGTAALPLDDGLATNGRYRYGDISLAIPPKGAVAGEPTRPDASRSDIALPSVAIEFEGDFQGAEQAWARAAEKEFNTAAMFFAQRYGLVVPGLKIQVTQLADFLSGSEALARYANKTIIVDRRAIRAIQHEYVHAIQEMISLGNDGPYWLIEGMAVYFEHALDQINNHPLHEENIPGTIDSSRSTERSLQSMETYPPLDFFEYQFIALAVHRLVSLAGEESLIEFYHLLSSSNSWEATFVNAFGMTVDEFYRDFTSWRYLVAPPLLHIRGTVLDTDGYPAQGIRVWAGHDQADETARDGKFSVAARGGTYVLMIEHEICGVMGFLDSEGGLARSEDDGRRIVVEADGVNGVVINLPVHPEQPCERGSGWWEWWNPWVEADELARVPGVKVTLLAGLPGPAYGGIPQFTDGSAEEALFNRPMGMALDASGNLVVADFWNDAIRHIAPDGVVTTVAGGNGPGARDGPGEYAQFAGPADVAVHADGSIYVADSRNHRIRRISPDGVVTTVAGGGPGGQEGSEGSFRDGSAASARFNFPISIVFDHDGNLLIADERNLGIRRLSPDGYVSTLFRSIAPSAITVDDSSTIFLSAMRGPDVEILKITSDRIVSTVFRSEDPSLGRPLSPYLRGICTGPDDVLYIADWLFSISGRIVRITQNGSLAVVVDKVVSEPTGMICTDDGALLVSDAVNNAIWRITFDAE